MTSITNIHIPEPCHQQWQQMTPADNGRHCEQCCKTVVDFTKMSNNEIISHLSTNRHVCGRIGEQQVNSINMQLVSRQPQNKGGWVKWMMAAALFASTAYSRANAQSATHAIEQTANSNTQGGSFRLVGKVAFPDSARYQIITGRVTDNNNKPIIGATIKTDHGNAAAQTNVDGNFRLRVPLSTKRLTISFLGFESTVVELKKAGEVLKVKLKENTIMLGGLGVTRSTLLKRLYVRYVPNSVRGIFIREA
ncbi:carboxypeptidase-like regulatory domain-containing protein [Mucilaginibacter sp. BJC16-A38]|uniref:carboxypeptidase-like regulatory domain-containing protein n=1 Tax=Mucilaginibacter phenanthrenivorans TaxID=1234842 RepID=UPI0021574852|nr:carboxypeptidase-like regulatory domain-containing protein [Mucilaginibacter phenanthrenivorans]MCR8557109.1 carboxypeptidase-like regulatory domain-containing protein [Mucilaginibacter phenanthrenivorans]